VKLTENSQHDLLHLNLWVVDEDVCTFFHEILGNSDARRLSAVTVIHNSTSSIYSFVYLA